ncbi:THUMP domain-containing class I SAM-dependent RNA methyltransferase [Roseovarius sp. 2305UL8-3]|uniref:THUMP domain-containing class I SAM-dependent RNA methyltransferase n=1 Tax=Roseovarius conchicola TaxID=3121636 RepID=UPI003527A17F
MRDAKKFEIFLGAPPGLELALKSEAQERGFAKPKAVPGGVRFRGAWPEVWRANLELRGAGRVLARLGGFQAMHLDQLKQRCMDFSWMDVLRRDVPVRVDVTCKSSRIYHERAAAQRIEDALREVLGVPIGGEDALRLMVRIEDNQCTFSVDTSGELLHKRGHKEAVGKAPLRETLAALFLRQSGYKGNEPVLDPMCGSGTFVIEAAEIAMGLPPGRSRSFAFEHLAPFDPDAWDQIRSSATTRRSDLQFYGSDRDAGAIKAAQANAARAGVGDTCQFNTNPISDLKRPEGPAGLVIVNPPYGDRIGDKRQLFGLYGAMGHVLKERFKGWRVGLITTDAGLAKATGLPFDTPSASVPHGGLKIALWQTRTL